MGLKGEERATLIAAVANLSAGKKLTEVVETASNGVSAVSFSVGAEATNAIPVTITAKTLRGSGTSNAALDNKVTLDLLIVSNTSTLAYNAADYTIAATTGTVLELVADKCIRVTTDATGVAVVTLTISGAATSYLVPVLPNGELGTASGAITHA